jgi:hypothetical protein
MKSVFVFLAIGIFLTFLTSYIVMNFSPFDLTKAQELVNSASIIETNPDGLTTQFQDIMSRGLLLEYISNNAYIAIFTLAAAFMCFLTSTHLFIDKVFFKSIWQPPSIFNAFRRAFLIIGSILLMVYLKAIKVETTTLILVPFTALVFEIVFLSIKNDIQTIISGFSKKRDAPTI